MKRSLLLLAFAWLGLVLEAACKTALPQWLPTPEMGLIVLLYAAMGRRGSSGGIAALALVLGYLTDLSTGAPRGLHMAVYTITGISAQTTASRILVGSTLATAIGSALFASWAGALSVILRVAVNPAIGWGVLGAVPGTALATAVAAPVLFSLLERMEVQLALDPVADRRRLR